MEIAFKLNGEAVTLDVPPDRMLLQVLRDSLGLMGTKQGCNIGQCGACSVIIDGKLRRACITPMSKVESCEIITIEGIHGPDGGPNDLQQAFVEHSAMQCGFCTPGMVLAGEVLLMHNPDPSRAEIRRAITGNLCRCTGYQQIIDAIEATAKQRLAQHALSAAEEKEVGK
jgi:carbon-monoxide dehydrogenase small subunit